MSRFTKDVRFETQFDGDIVIFMLRRLSNPDSMKVAPFIEERADGSKKLGFKSMLEFLGVIKEIAPNCFVSMTGLKDADGNAVDLETALSATYFSKLIITAFNKLIEISFVGEQEAKNSAAPSPAA